MWAFILRCDQRVFPRDFSQQFTKKIGPNLHRLLYLALPGRSAYHGWEKGCPKRLSLYGSFPAPELEDVWYIYICCVPKFRSVGRLNIYLINLAAIHVGMKNIPRPHSEHMGMSCFLHFESQVGKTVVRLKTWWDFMIPDCSNEAIFIGVDTESTLHHQGLCIRDVKRLQGGPLLLINGGIL